jgi:hypothetical protein
MEQSWFLSDTELLLTVRIEREAKRGPPRSVVCLRPRGLKV